MHATFVKGWSADIARGSNPKQPIKTIIEKKEKNITFKEFFIIFTDRHRVYNKNTSIKTDNYNIKNWIMPFFGEKNLNEISRKDILSFKDMMKKTPMAYNRCFNVLRSAFNRANEWEYLLKGKNPCEKILCYRENKKERFLSQDELKKLEDILDSEFIIKKFSREGIDAVKLLIYTGCRKMEVLTLKWEDVYLEENYFLLKDSKNGERIVPLNEISKNILSNIIKNIDNPFVFPARKKNVFHRYTTFMEISSNLNKL